MSIYKKQSDDLKTFETAEEFLKYYDNNKKDIDETHTRSLNLKFKITGHTIGRKQGKLILYPKKEFKEESAQENGATKVAQEDEKYEQLKQAILQLNERLKILEERFQEQPQQQQFMGAYGSGTSVPKPDSLHQLYYHK